MSLCFCLWTAAALLPLWLRQLGCRLLIKNLQEQPAPAECQETPKPSPCGQTGLTQKLCRSHIEPFRNGIAALDTDFGTPQKCPASLAKKVILSCNC